MSGFFAYRGKGYETVQGDIFNADTSGGMLFVRV